jgi:nucleoredoxin
MMNWTGGIFIAGLCAVALWLSIALGDYGISSSEMTAVKGDLVAVKEAASFARSPASSGSAPAQWAKLLGDSLILPSGATVPPSSLEGEFLALYFSASWCPPCRKFLPILKKFYEENEGRIQIVLMGQDRSPQSRAAYYEKAQMPWPSVPFGSSLPDELTAALGVLGIPALLVFDSEGELVRTDAIADILESPESAIEKWEAR